MSVLRKEIAWILVFKVVLLTVLWWLCFSKPLAEQPDSRQVFSSHVYGVNSHVPNRSSR